MEGIRHRIEAIATPPSGAQEFIDVNLYFNTTDPYVIIMTVFDPNGELITEWELSRELLELALISEEPEGSGDITMWVEQAGFFMLLCPPAFSAKLEFHAEDIEKFAEEIESLTPETDDAVNAAIDAWLTDVLGG